MISAPGGAPGIDSSIHTSALAGGAQMALLRDGYYNHFARGADPRGPTRAPMKTYDAREALDAMNAVEVFMRKLAVGP